MFKFNNHTTLCHAHWCACEERGRRLCRHDASCWSPHRRWPSVCAPSSSSCCQTSTFFARLLLLLSWCCRCCERRAMANVRRRHSTIERSMVDVAATTSLSIVRCCCCCWQWCCRRRWFSMSTSKILPTLPLVYKHTFTLTIYLYIKIIKSHLDHTVSKCLSMK
jgi:hypothetical protein